MTQRQILIDITPLQSEHRVRGVGTYVLNLIRELALLYPDSLEFLASTVNGSGIGTELPHVYKGFRPHKPAQVYWLYNELFLRRSFARIRPALFHATDFNGVLSSPDIPVVTTLYDLTPLEESSQNIGGLSHHLSMWRWRTYFFRKLPRVSHIIAISGHAKSQACDKLGLDPNRITVIPLGVNHHLYTPKAQGQGVFAHHAPYFLYVGGADRNKNLSRLIEAFSLMAHQWPDIELLLAGKWQTETANMIQRDIEDKQLGLRIHLLGFVPSDDLPSLYANALAFVFPSLSEGFGLPIIEAMASGIPVIASDIPVFREVAENASLLVDPKDTERWAQAMVGLLSSPERLKNLGEVGQKRSREFHWRKVAEDTWAVYQKVLQGL